MTPPAASAAAPASGSRDRSAVLVLWAVLSLFAALLGCAKVVGAPAHVTSAAPPAGTESRDVMPLVMGETLRVDSRILGERRVVNVYFPPGYSDGNARFPVLYMPDGGRQEDFPHVMGLVDVSVKNETMRPFVVVGIENTARRRDLVGPTTLEAEKKIAPQAGGADKFRRFLREELKPLVAARYRITPESAIVGESFAGLFVVETFLVEPDLFDAYIAVSPSVWWNDGALVRGAKDRLAAWSGKPKALFVATGGDEMETKGDAAALDAALKELKLTGLIWDYVPMQEEKHATIFHPAAMKAFRMLFAPQKKPGGS